MLPHRMERTATTPLYLPDALDDGAQLAWVASCPVREGATVARGATVLEVQAGLADLSVESPVTGHLAKLHVSAGDVVSVGELIAEISEEEEDADYERQPSPRRGALRTAGDPNDSSRRIVQRTPLLLALALAGVALIRPMAWLAVCAVVAVLAAAARTAGIDHAVRGPADVVVLPLRLLAGLVAAARAKLAGLVGPFVALALIALWLLISVLVPAALGGVFWLVSHGTDGALAAMRLAVFSHAPRVFAFIACVWLLSRAFGAMGERLRTASALLPEWGLTAVVAAGSIWLVLCAVVFAPKIWWPSDSFRAFAQDLPTGLRDFAEGQRRAIVQAEARAVVDCMADRGRAGWREPRAHLLDDGSILVGVRADRRDPPGRRSLATLLVALNNQLAPHGATVEIAPPHIRAATIRFRPEGAARPLTDVRRVIDVVELNEASVDPLARAAKVAEASKGDGLACSSAAIY